MAAKIDDLLARYDRMKSRRDQWMDLWQELADVLHPNAGDFVRFTEPGTRRTDEIFDGVPRIAMLSFLFSGGKLPSCYVVADSDPVELTSSGLAIVDWNGDEEIAISDGIAGLNFLFADGLAHKLGRECVVIAGDCEERCVE